MLINIHYVLHHISFILMASFADSNILIIQLLSLTNDAKYNCSPPYIYIIPKTVLFVNIKMEIIVISIFAHFVCSIFSYVL